MCDNIGSNMEMKYKSSIRFDEPRDVRGHFLEFEVKYQRKVTKDEHEELVLYYNDLYKQRHGEHVKLEEISVSPKEGEFQDETAYFVTQLQTPLSHIAKSIHRKAPYVLPKLIDDLNNIDRNKLRDMDRKLLNHTIDRLTEIVEPERRKDKSLLQEMFKKYLPINS